MWKSDDTQHIHVDPSVPETEVLRRATEVACSANPQEDVCIDLIASSDIACACQAPSHWKTYRVIIHAPLNDEQKFI